MLYLYSFAQDGGSVSPGVGEIQANSFEEAAAAAKSAYLAEETYMPDVILITCEDLTHCVVSYDDLEIVAKIGSLF